jgi:hypothetical protein
MRIHNLNVDLVVEEKAQTCSFAAADNGARA